MAPPEPAPPAAPSEAEELRQQVRTLRETLDETLHQIELQALTIDGLRLQLLSAYAKLAAAGGKPGAKGASIPPPALPPRPVNAAALDRKTLIALARREGARVKELHDVGREVDTELLILHDAVQLLKDGKLEEADVVLRGLALSLDTAGGPTAPSPAAPG